MDGLYHTNFYCRKCLISFKNCSSNLEYVCALINSPNLMRTVLFVINVINYHEQKIIINVLQIIQTITTKILQCHMCMIMIPYNYVIFDSLNLSNHNIVELRISCFNNNVYSRSAQLHSDKTPKCAWYKSTSINLENYRTVLDNSLSAIKQNQNVLYCTDIKCKSIHHRNGIDKLCKCIIDSCIDAGNATIPSYQIQ